MGDTVDFDGELTEEEILAMGFDETEGTESEEADSEEADTEGTDSEETDTEGTESEETDSEGTESEETDSEETDSEETDSEETESEETDTEGTESEGTESEEADSEEADSEEADTNLFDVVEPDFAIAEPDVSEVDTDDARVSELNTAMAELTKKLSDGDIDVSEYSTEHQKIANELNNITVSNALKQNQLVQNKAQLERQWLADANAFIKANPMFSAEENPALFGALDANIKAISTSDGAANMSNRDILKEAATRVHKQLASLMPKEPKNKVVAQKKKSISAKKKQTNAGKSVKTLRDSVPAKQNTSSSEFTYIDKLEGAKLEKALGELSPEKLAKYMAE